MDSKVGSVVSFHPATISGVTALLSPETVLKETLFLNRKWKPGLHDINAEKNTTKSKKKKKEIEKVSQAKMDLTKLTQNEEIPTVATTNFDADSFVKGYHA